MALFTVAALFVLNAVIVAAGAAKYGLAGQQLLGLKAHWDVLTSLASALSAVALTFGAILFLAGLTKPPTLRAWGKSLVCALTWIAFGFTLLAVILGALSLGLYAIFTAQLPAPPTTATRPIQVLATSTILMTSALVVAGFLFQAIRRSACQATANKKLFVIFFIAGFSLFLISLFGPLFLCLISVPESYLPSGVFNFLANPIWVWPFLLLLSYKVRELMIQYVGDVVAYISPNKLDRFCKIRAEIKDVAYKSASAVYLAQDDDGSLLYDKVAIVGHSLGSVIAYDTLNKLLNADALAFTRFDVIGRTCLLETFGSPLDKIAFFFSIQGKDSFEIREQLAGVVQPMISSRESRMKIPWVNVYSLNDIVSGRVRLYDDPTETASSGTDTSPNEPPELVPPVHRLIDPDAIVPIVAHVEYWRNSTIWRCLTAALAGAQALCSPAPSEQ